MNFSDSKIDTKAIKCFIRSIGDMKDKIPGPHDYYLISSFSLSKIDSSKYQKINTLTTAIDKNSIYYQEWLPENIIKTLFETSYFEEVPVFKGIQFFKSPYLDVFFILSKDSTIYL